jgi:hypothetical protein
MDAEKTKRLVAQELKMLWELFVAFLRGKF